MGLFDDLPSAKRSAAAAEREASPAAKRVKAEPEVGGSIPVLPAAGCARTETDAAGALDRLAAHLANPNKFKKAAALAITLMRSGDLERKHGKSLFSLLNTAMDPDPKRANEPANRYEYRRLFDAAEECMEDGVFNAKHKARIAVWMLHVRTVNDVYTDDTFAFDKATKAIRELVDALGPYEPCPEEPAARDAAGATTNDGSETAPPQGEEEAEARACAERMAAAEHRAEVEAWRLREDERTALLDAVDAAHAHYKHAWAQTTVDMLLDFVHEQRAKFSPEQAGRIVKVWEQVRDKKNARKGGGGGAGDQTAFERGAAVYKNAAISIRRAVGGEGCRDGRGESAFSTFGQ